MSQIPAAFARLIGAVDESAQSVEKRAVGYLCVGALAASAVCAAASEFGGNRAFLAAGVSLAFCASLATFALLVVFPSNPVPDPVASVLVACLIVSVALADLDAASSFTERKWPLFLPIEAALAWCRVGGSFKAASACLAAGWIVLASFEEAFRFGLFDAAGTAAYTKRAETTACSEPPCDTGTRGLVRSCCLGVGLVALQFAYGRWAAKTAADERRTAAALARTTTAVAAAAGKFDLEAAECALRGGDPGDTDAPLSSTLHERQAAPEHGTETFPPDPPGGGGCSGPPETPPGLAARRRSSANRHRRGGRPAEIRSRRWRSWSRR
ncbi:hypothetical protein DIPPA_12742 [Diplonema papillatum]|nr:hypothetical protein DIPPA_12742 [Diplonema papillatum]